MPVELRGGSRASVGVCGTPCYKRHMAGPFDDQEGKGWFGAMGMRLVQATAERVEVRWTVGPEHLQPFGLVHGGVYCGAVETVCSIGANLAAGAEAEVVGVENHTSFLRPVERGELQAVASPLHVGRVSQLWQADVLDEAGRRVATGRLRVFCRSRPSDGSGGGEPPASRARP